MLFCRDVHLSAIINVNILAGLPGCLMAPSLSSAEYLFPISAFPYRDHHYLRYSIHLAGREELNAIIEDLLNQEIVRPSERPPEHHYSPSRRGTLTRDWALTSWDPPLKPERGTGTS